MNKLSFTTRIIIFLFGIAVLAGIGSFIVEATIYISIICILGILGVLGYKLFVALFSKS